MSTDSGYTLLWYTFLDWQGLALYQVRTEIDLIVSNLHECELLYMALLHNRYSS